MEEPEPQPEMNQPARFWREPELWLLLLLAAGTYLARLDVLPIRGEEPRRARVAYEMLATGDWIVPRQQGDIYLSRPAAGQLADRGHGLSAQRDRSVCRAAAERAGNDADFDLDLCLLPDMVDSPGRVCRGDRVCHDRHGDRARAAGRKRGRVYLLREWFAFALALGLPAALAPAGAYNCPLCYTCWRHWPA